MEDDFNFFEQIHKLKDKKKLILNNKIGTIEDIEEVEHEIFKLSVQIEGKIYKGIYIDNKKFELEKNDSIILFSIKLIKKERNIYLYSFLEKNDDEDDENIETNKIMNKENLENYDLNPPNIIKTIAKNLNINYKSDIFIYKNNSKEYILIPILENKEIRINFNKEFEKFVIENNLKDDSLIFIDNYILDNNEISFNYFTLFNLIKLEYLDEYFKTHFHIDYKDNSIIYYQLNLKNKYDFVFLKVIDIQDNSIICIDYFLNMYKILKNNEKIENLKNVYTIIFIKNFDSSIENEMFLLTLNKKSYIYVFENTFDDLLLNNLTVINLNCIDLIDSIESNLFNKIKLDINGNIYFLEIKKKSEYIILFTKFNLFFNLFSFYIQLISQKYNEIHFFQVSIYLGLLNKINSMINYYNKESYGYEYFYFNFNYDLPKNKVISIKEKAYNINYYDNFDSKARKRFIILNYYDNENTKKYDKGKKLINKEPKLKIFNKNKRKENNEIKKKDISTEFIDDYDEIYEKVNHKSLIFSFYYERNKEKLLGIYDLEEIIDKSNNKKEYYKPKEEYKIFYNYFKIIKDKNYDKEKKEIYLKTIQKYINNKDIENLVKNYNIDFSNINYENYIIFINICLFYYSNLTSEISFKDLLISEFNDKFTLLINTKIPLKDRIRIIRFICIQAFRVLDDKRTMHLLIADNLENDNSYKIALNYNKSIINNLNENSKLYLPFLQLDSYILFNYNTNSYCYTLSLEPLIITKKHLLSTYDDFIFTHKEKEENNKIVLAFQSNKNDITAINEYGLFPENNNCDSKALTGNDFAVPISMELLHERNGHSKKAKKNKRNTTPIYFYKKKKIMKIKELYQEKDKETKKMKGEAGLLIEYFIRYNKKSLIDTLKKNLTLGNIINNVNLFTSRNFKDLANQINNNKKKPKKNKQLSKFDESLIMNKIIKNKEENENEIKEKDKKDIELGIDKQNEPHEESLEYYEKKYLLNGNIFVYPYSIPIDYISYGTEEKKISEGLRQYLKKYEKAIISGRRQHYGEE